MIFDPTKPAAEMTAAELMACHVAMSDSALSGSSVVTQVENIYAELNRKMGKDKEYKELNLIPCED